MVWIVDFAVAAAGVPIGIQIGVIGSNARVLRKDWKDWKGGMMSSSLISGDGEGEREFPMARTCHWCSTSEAVVEASELTSYARTSGVRAETWGTQSLWSFPHTLSRDLHLEKQGWD